MIKSDSENKSKGEERSEERNKDRSTVKNKKAPAG